MPQQNKNKRGKYNRTHSAKDRKNGGKGKHDGKNKGKGKGKGQQPNPLYDPRETLTGHDLRQYVKAQTRLQTRPTINANRRLVKTLQQVLGAQTDQLQGLDKQAGRNISSYYSDLAKRGQQSLAVSNALGAQLRGQVGQQGVSTQKAIAGAAAGAQAAQAGDEALRGGTPTSARAQLQQMIVQQQGDAAREQAAIGNAAAARSNDWVNALAMQQQAAQQQGAATLSDTHRQIANQVSDLQSQFLPDIREAAGQIRDIRKSKGDIRSKALADAIDRERQYLLSKGALGVDKDQLKLDAKTSKRSANSQLAVAKQYGKNKRAEQRRSLHNQLAVAKAQGDNKKAEQIRSKLNQLDIIDAQQGGKGGKGGSDKLPGSQKKRRRALAYVHSDTPGYVATHKQHVIDTLISKYGITPDVAEWAWKKYTKKYRRGGQSFSGQGGQQDFNEAHPLG